LEIEDIEKVDLKSKSLQTRIFAAEFFVELLNKKPGLQEQVQILLSKQSLVRTRKEKTFDMRHLIQYIYLPDNGTVNLAMRLSARPGETGRPDEVMDELGYKAGDYLVERTRLLLDQE
jgi:hypothetical protein